jgi:hypothetical protein
MSRFRAITITVALQLACETFSDPAVRLAYCIERATGQGSRENAPVHANCDIGISGRYAVVLYPQDEVGDDQLVSAGFPPALLVEMQELRKIGKHSAIYVIAADPEVTGTGSDRSVLSSFTTYQNNFVRIPRLMVLVKTSQPVEVEIASASDGPLVQGIR